MTTANTLSSNGLAYLKRCESLKLEAYRDGAGVWTLGYGCTGPEVGEGATCTQEQAEEMLSAKLAKFDAAVARMCPKATPGQHDAMVSLAFNVGAGAAGFMGSTVRRLHMAGDFEGAADAFLMWNKLRNLQTGELESCDGLHKRRIMDRAIYLGATADEAVDAGEQWLNAKRAGALDPIADDGPMMPAARF